MHLCERKCFKSSHKVEQVIDVCVSVSSRLFATFLLFITLLIVVFCQVLPFEGGHRRRMQFVFGAKNAFALYARGTEENRSSTKERQL